MTFSYDPMMVLHAAIMATFAATFLLMRRLDRDLALPPGIAYGFLVAAVAPTLLRMSRAEMIPGLATLMAVATFLGPMLIAIGIARIARQNAYERKWWIYLAIYVALNIAFEALGLSISVNFALINLSLVGASIIFYAIISRLPREQHPLGRPLLLTVAVIAITLYTLRLITLVIGYGRDGGSLDAQYMVIVMSGVMATCIGIAIVVLVAERLSAQIRMEARTDGLTGLATRRVFDAHMRQELSRWSRHRRPFAVILFDIDFFKRVNDAYGHDVGDQALQLVAKLGAESLRPTDLFARIGGDEFAVLCPETTPAEARALAARILERLRATPLAARAEQIALTGSFGIAGPMEPDDSAEAVIKRADQASYLVKRRGRDDVAVFDAA